MSSSTGIEDKEVPFPLRILLLEDVPEEAEVLQHELRKAEIAFVARCVQSRAKFIEELERFAPVPAETLESLLKLDCLPRSAPPEGGC